MSDRDTGLMDFCVAFALGALAGASLALVMAPERGDKTRKKLEKKSRKLRKKAGKRLDEAGDRVREIGEDWYDEAEDFAADLSKQIADVVEEGVRAIRDTVGEEIKDFEKKLGRKKGLFG